MSGDLEEGASSLPGPCLQLGACMAGGGAQMTDPSRRSAKAPSLFSVCFHLFLLHSLALLSFVWPLVLNTFCVCH